MSAFASGLSQSQRPVARLEWLLVVALFLVGAALRCAFPERMAVEHFDEGVYASNYWFGAGDEYRYPAQHLYAPPLLPVLIEWTFILLGPSNLAAMLPSLVAGCLTVPLVWWIGRSWFGPAAGVAASALCALSDPHIAFSRTALTDVLLCFWLLLAVHFLWRALTTRRPWPTIVAGLFTGLAWWTKYTGWLPLAIGAAALVPWALQKRRTRPASAASPFRLSEPQGSTAESEISNLKSQISDSKLQVRAPAPPADDEPEVSVLKSQISNLKSEIAEARTETASLPAALPAEHSATGPSRVRLLVGASLRWSVIAAIAFAVWSPWLWSLQSQGGYAAVAANHRGYVVSWGGWLQSFDTQVARNMGQLEGTCSHHSVIVALLLVLVWARWNVERFTWNTLLGHAASWTLVAALYMATPALEPVGLTALLALVGIPATMIATRSIEHPAIRDRVSLAGWLLVAWFIGLTVTTPLYRPYPRLMLPWLVACWLGAGVGVSALLAWLLHVSSRANLTRYLSWALLSRRSGPAPRGVILFGLFAAAIPVVWYWETELMKQCVPGWDDRTSFVSLALQYRKACHDRLQSENLDPDRFVIYTTAQPALLFQLRLSGVDLVRPLMAWNEERLADSARQVPTFLSTISRERVVRSRLMECGIAPPFLKMIDDVLLPFSRMVELDHADPFPR